MKEQKNYTKDDLIYMISARTELIRDILRMCASRATGDPEDMGVLVPIIEMAQEYADTTNKLTSELEKAHMKE